MADTQTIHVPDIGDFTDVEVIEVQVKAGDSVQKEDPLITLESDKATLDIPSPCAGKITEVLVKTGDRVSAGSDILIMDAVVADEPEESTAVKVGDREEQPTRPATESGETEGTATGDNGLHEATPAAEVPASVADPRAPRHPPAGLPTGSSTLDNLSSRAHASPSVRRFARELGIDIGLVRGSGRKGRITKDDIKAFTRSVMSGNRAFGGSGGLGLPEIPAVDFSRYGPVETKPLSRVKRLAGQNLRRAWLTVPQVTQFNQADITDLEEFRQSRLEAAEQQNIKLTLVSFLLKAVVVTLERYPEFNASLSSTGEELVFKQYYHIGIAVNTDDGLMVPVVRDVDQKGLFELAAEISDLSDRARDGRIRREEMQGGCFTVSSLGGVGGTYFTPIVNMPEVAILGVSRAGMQPVYRDGDFIPRLMLPFALSYDHRVIDGVAGARFTEHLRTVLTDIRHILL